MRDIVNRKAYYEYEVLEVLECGLVLKGSEVKSVKNGQVNIADSYAKVIKGELFLWNADIQLYKYSSDPNYDPFRSRKILVKKSELFRIMSKIKQSRLTLIPLKLYEAHGKVKLLIGLCKGRKRYEKKNREKARDLEREVHVEKRINL